MRPTYPLLAAGAALALSLPASATAQVAVPAGGQVSVFESPFALAAGDVDRAPDLYVRGAGSARLVTDGAATGKHAYAGASADGSVVFFYGEDDRLQVRTPAGLAQLSAESVFLEEVSADGTRAYLVTSAQLTADDSDDKKDVYEYATATGTMRLVSKETPDWDAGFAWSMPDGTALFHTREQIEIADLDEQVDAYANGGGAILKVTPGSGEHPAYLEAVSTQTGRMVFSTSEALVPADTDSSPDLYSSYGGAPALLTPSPNANAAAKAVHFVASRAADAGRVVFHTAEALVASDADGGEDLYAWEAGQLKLLSPGAGAVHLEDVSEDAETVLFSTTAKLLASDSDEAADMYASGDGGLAHLLKTNQPFDQASGRLSPDGSVAAFVTAEAVTPADADQKRDVYVHSDDTVSLASAPATGAAADPAVEAGVTDALATGEVVFHTTERLLASDRHDGSDAYGFLDGKLSLISADEHAPETTMATSEAGGAFTSVLSTTEQGGFECRTDGGAWAACDSPWTVGPLGAGQHVLEARAVDVSGNPDATPAQHVVTIAGPKTVVVTEEPPKPPVTGEQPDRVAPKLTAARLRLRRRVPSLAYSLSESATVRVTVQRRAGRRWKALRSARLSGSAGRNAARLARLPRRGTFRIVVLATDAAGNVSPKLVLRPKGR